MPYCNILSTNKPMGPVLIWPGILTVTSGLLYKYKINFNYIKDRKT